MGSNSGGMGERLGEELELSGAPVAAIRDTIACIACLWTSIAHTRVCATLSQVWYCGYVDTWILLYCTYSSIAHTAKNQYCESKKREQGARALTRV